MACKFGAGCNKKQTLRDAVQQNYEAAIRAEERAERAEAALARAEQANGELVDHIHQWGEVALAYERYVTHLETNWRPKNRDARRSAQALRSILHEKSQPLIVAIQSSALAAATSTAVPQPEAEAAPLEGER